MFSLQPTLPETNEDVEQQFSKPNVSVVFQTDAPATTSVICYSYW